MAVAMEFSPSYHHVSTTNYLHHHHHHHHLMIVKKKKSVLTMRPPHNTCTRYYHVPSYSQHYLHVSPSPCDQNDSDFEGLCRHGHIKEALPLLFFQIMDPQSSLLPPLFFTLFRSCSKKKSLHEAKLVHAHLFSYGLESFTFIGEGLVEMLVKCGGFDDAIQIVYVLPYTTSNTWTNLIIEYIESGQSQHALRMYRAMQEMVFTQSINPYNYVNMFKACANVADLKMGKVLHEEAWAKTWLKVNAFVGSTIITMYGKCGCIIEARKVFDELSERDVVTWNAMLSAYIEEGKEEDALLLQPTMQDEGVSSNARTLVIALQACYMLADKTMRDTSLQEKENKETILKVGRTLHTDACFKGFELDVFVANSLVNMYGKCGRISEAEYVFRCNIPIRNVVSWTLLLSIYMEQDEENKVLHAYRQMQEEGVQPNEWTFSIVFQACCMLLDKEEAFVVANQRIKVFSLKIVQALHHDVRRNGLHSNVFVGSRLVSTYGKCGSIVEAENVFQGLQHPDAIAWSAMMSAYVEVGDGKRALQLFNQIDGKYLILDEQIFVIALQACCVLAEGKNLEAQDDARMKKLALEIGELIYADVVKRGLDLDTFVSNAIFSMYSKCGVLEEAENVFYGSSPCDAMLWMSMLSAYVDQDQEKAIMLYRQMSEEGCLGDNGRSYVMALQACNLLGEKDKDTDMIIRPIMSMALEIGQGLHADATKKGMLSNVYVGSALIGLYGTCGDIVEAENVFSCLSLYDMVAWNTMLLAYVKQNLPERALQFFLHMQKDLSVVPNNRTFVIILQACWMLAEEEEAVLVDGQFIKTMCLEIGEAMHQDIENLGFIADPFVNNSLICMYGKCGNILEAEVLFGSSCKDNVVPWNIMLSIYAEHGFEEKIFQLLNQMWKEGIDQDERTFLIAFQACCELAQQENVVREGKTLKEISLEFGRLQHSLARRKGMDSDIFVSSSLISMYGKCGSIVDAENVFAGLLQRDSVSWNSIIHAYVYQGEPERGLQIYTEMQRKGFRSNSRTFVVALEACCAIAEKVEEKVGVEVQSFKSTSLEIGRALHMDARQSKFCLDAFVVSALVSMYGKCGGIEEAEKVLSESSQYCGLIAHNAMLSAYIENGQAESALNLFRAIQKESFSMDHLTLWYALQACSMIGTVDMCRHIHWMIVSCEYDSIPLLATALIHTYGNCATVRDAQATFDLLEEADIISWTVLLTCYAQQGNYSVNIRNFREMQFYGIEPDGVTFLSLLCACNHAGVTSDGILYFKLMLKDYGINPKMEHFSIMIDILGRAGDFGNAEGIMSKMPMNPDLTTWLCLLSACRHHGKFELGKEAFKSAVNLHPMLESSYILMANMYADNRS